MLHADPWRRSSGRCIRAGAVGFHSKGVTRTYYIAADEVVWDYAPSGTNLAEGRAFNDIEKPWMEAGPHVIGRKAKKALYREYTDATFTTLKPRPAAWEHLGFLGPLVRAEVGDTIKIVFRNNAKFAGEPSTRTASSTTRTRKAPFTTTVRAAPTRPTTRVPTGGTHIYTWEVPERAGPGRARGQLRVLDVSLARRRDPRRRQRPDRPDDRHAQGHGAPTARRPTSIANWSPASSRSTRTTAGTSRRTSRPTRPIQAGTMDSRSPFGDMTVSPRPQARRARRRPTRPPSPAPSAPTSRKRSTATRSATRPG